MPHANPVKKVTYVLKRHKLSYRALAQHMGCRVATVNDWATGKVKISKVYQEKLNLVHQMLLRKEEEEKQKPPLIDL